MRSKRTRFRWCGGRLGSAGSPGDGGVVEEAGELEAALDRRQAVFEIRDERQVQQPLGQRLRRRRASRAFCAGVSPPAPCTDVVDARRRAG